MNVRELIDRLQQLDPEVDLLDVVGFGISFEPDEELLPPPPKTTWKGDVLISRASGLRQLIRGYRLEGDALDLVRFSGATSLKKGDVLAYHDRAALIDRSICLLSGDAIRGFRHNSEWPPAFAERLTT